MEDRLARLRDKMQENGLDAILISQPENRRYLSGFTGSAGYLIISQDHAFIATDFRYFEQSARQAPEFQLFKMVGGKPFAWLLEALATIKPRRLGFEAGDVSFSLYSSVKKALAEVTSDQRPRLISTQNLVETLRAVKDPSEMAEIEKAASMADAALARVVPAIQAGTTEKAVAWELEKAMRESGADALSFETIVASGPNGALPHHRPSERVIQQGEPIVIDMGAKVNGYCSDITRTVVVGKAGDRLKKVYDTVLGAQLTAIAMVASGMTGQEADGLARTVIDQAGYGDKFGHSLGHGIGLAVHEHPWVGPRGSGPLEQSMVFTIEPGIYLPEWGGVRIEDMVVLENGKARVITKTSKVLD